jgi:PAS domain-containing protein
VDIGPIPDGAPPGDRTVFGDGNRGPVTLVGYNRAKKRTTLRIWSKPLAKLPSRAHLIDLLARERLHRMRSNHAILTNPTPICAVDKRMAFTAWNWAMEEMSGIPADDVLGLVAPDRFPILAKNGALPRVEEALRGHQSREWHIYTYETGIHVLTRTERRPIYGPGGSIEGMAAVTTWQTRVAIEEQ